MLKAYPQFSEHYVLYELPMVRGWVYIAYANETDPWLQFAGLKRKSRGYIGAEIADLMEQAGYGRR